jgi:hypothetical protein
VRLALGPKWFMAEADQPPGPVKAPFVKSADPAGEVLNPPKTMCPLGQGGVDAVPNYPVPTVADPETSVSSGLLLCQQ